MTGSHKRHKLTKACLLLHAIHVCCELNSSTDEMAIVTVLVCAKSAIAYLYTYCLSLSVNTASYVRVCGVAIYMVYIGITFQLVLQVICYLPI